MQSLNYEDYDVLAKIIMIGDFGTGRTSLVMRYTSNTFDDPSYNILSLHFRQKIVKFEAKKIMLQIWDIASAERNPHIHPSYYKGAKGALLVFDISDRKSFESIKTRFQKLRQATNNSKIKVIVIGNKSDKAKQRKVSLDEVVKFTTEYNVQYLETSAKLNENVNQAFQMLIKGIFDNFQTQFRNVISTQSFSNKKMNRVGFEKIWWMKKISPAVFLIVLLFLVLVFLGLILYD